MNVNLPEMTIEKREPETHHSVMAPDISDANLRKQFGEAVVLNNDAKFDGWQESTIEILLQYIPLQGIGPQDIKTAVKDVMSYTCWKQVSFFVEDDLCSEFFNMCLKYCLTQKQVHQKEKGFIDGSGIGYVKAYLKRLKVTIEKCFDAKYFFKVKRPLVYAIEDLGLIELTVIANAVHPGHWSYPAGHGTKFLTAVEVMRDIFHLDEFCYNNLLIAACVASMGRSGLLIHYPMDNLAGGKLTNLKEFF